MKIKVKVKLFLCLIKYSIMQTNGIVEVLLNTFLSLVLDGGECHFHVPATILLGKETPLPTG